MCDVQAILAAAGEPGTRRSSRAVQVRTLNWHSTDTQLIINCLRSRAVQPPKRAGMVVDDGRIRSPIRRTTSRSACHNKEVLHRKEVLTGGGRISLATPKGGVRYGPRPVAEEKCTRGDCPGGECVRPARHPGHCKSVDWVKSHKGKVVASAGADAAKGGKKRAGDRKRKADSPAGALPPSPTHGAAALHRRTPHTTAACFAWPWEVCG